MLKKTALAAAALIGLLSPAAFAGSPGPKYELRRQGMGPRPDQYVLVRVDRTRGDRPHTLTTDSPRPPTRRVVIRFAGPRYIGPVTVWE